MQKARKINLKSVLLIHPPNVAKKADNIVDIEIMPMGLFSIADILKRNGFDAQILHMGVELNLNPRFRIEKYVSERKFEIVGIGIHWHKQLATALDLVKIIKKWNKKLFIFLGGFTASFFAAELLRKNRWLDGVVKGDAEIPVLRLAQELSAVVPDLDRVPNLIRKKGKELAKSQDIYVPQQKDLDAFEFASLRLLKNARKYISQRKFYFSGRSQNVFHLTVGRGCPYNCSFCGGGDRAQKLISNRKGYVFRSPQKVVHTMKLALSYGYSSFYIGFDPEPQGDYYFKLFRLIRESGIKASCCFGCWGLPSGRFMRAFAETFDRAALEISPETYSEKLRRINKGIFYTNEELEHKLGLLNKYKIEGHLYFGYFLPFDTPNDVLETIVYSRKLVKIFSPAVSCFYLPLSTDPVSPLFMDPLKYKVTLLSRNAEDYCRHIKFCNEKEIDGNMLLHHPSNINKAELLPLRQAVNFSHIVFTSYGGIIKGVDGDSVRCRKFVEGAYRYFKQNPNEGYIFSRESPEKIIRAALKILKSI